MSVKIVGTSLERDMHSKGLLETNLGKAQEYLARRNQLKQKFSSKDSEIAELRNEINELREMMKMVLCKLDKE